MHRTSKCLSSFCVITSSLHEAKKQAAEGQDGDIAEETMILVLQNYTGRIAFEREQRAFS
jgi:hypothetical protein